MYQIIFFMYVQVNGNLNLPYVILHSDISNTGACSSQFQLCSCMFICYSQVIRTNKIYAKSVRKDLVRMIGHSANYLNNMKNA